MSEFKASCVYPSHCEHGEGILIDWSENYLYWVDIPEGKLYSYQLESKKTKIYLLPEQIGFIVLDKPGYLIGGLQRGLARIELSSGELTWLGRPSDMPQNSRFNDGKRDRQGRIWANTMDLDAVDGRGSLYCCTIGARDQAHFKSVDCGFTIGNGPTWSTDYTTFYHTETRRSTIFAYDFDEKKGALSNKRAFYQHKENDVRPDGMCTDSDSHLWIALAHGGRLLRLNPAGNIVNEIDVNTSFPTSCAMAYDQKLYITTSRKVSAPGEKLNGWSGNLLVLDRLSHPS